MRKFWQKWKLIAQHIGNFQTTVIFSIFYYLIVVPIGLISSLFYDFLGRKSSGWSKYEIKTEKIEDLKNQF